MGGVFNKIQTFGNEAVKGVVPVSSTVRDEKTLGKGGANQNIIYVRKGEEEAYVGSGKYPVNNTRVDMWVQVLMTAVRGANSTLTYGRPKGDERGDRWRGCGRCVRSGSISSACERRRMPWWCWWC
jgi:hypothetical protein